MRAHIARLEADAQEDRKHRETLERSVTTLMVDVRYAFQLVNQYRTARMSVPIFQPPAAHAHMVGTESRSLESRRLTKL